MNIKEIYKFISPRHQNMFLEFKVNFKPRYGGVLAPHPELYAIINENRQQYESILNKLLDFKPLLWQIQNGQTRADKNEPVWNNGFLPGLDIITLYAMLCIYRPQN